MEGFLLWANGLVRLIENAEFEMRSCNPGSFRQTSTAMVGGEDDFGLYVLS